MFSAKSRALCKEVIHPSQYCVLLTSFPFIGDNSYLNIFCPLFKVENKYFRIQKAFPEGLMKEMLPKKNDAIEACRLLCTIPLIHIHNATLMFKRFKTISKSSFQYFYLHRNQDAFRHFSFQLTLVRVVSTQM